MGGFSCFGWFLVVFGGFEVGVFFGGWVVLVVWAVLVLG